MQFMKGSQTQITPKEFVDRFYRNRFDVYGLRYEKTFGDIAVSLRFRRTCFYPSIDEPIYEAIGFFCGESDNNADCSVIIYTGDIKTIRQRYGVFKDKEIGVLHKDYDYSFVMNDGKELKFECNQQFDS